MAYIVRAYSQTRRILLTSRPFDTLADASTFAQNLSAASFPRLVYVTVEAEDSPIVAFRRGENLSIAHAIAL